MHSLVLAVGWGGDEGIGRSAIGDVAIEKKRQKKHTQLCRNALKCEDPRIKVSELSAGNRDVT